ncbi:MAG: hypothetical protein Q8K99_07910 [Actinomycetota bacterium]|nr:hypothetical protein [Actinomycetota bacterium]
MAVAARKASYNAQVSRRAPLRLAGSACGRRASSRGVSKCKSAYTACLTIMVALAVAGLGRVALSVEATETSFEKGVLARDIKAERLEGDLLEVDKSALTTPSRIERIAGSTMEMAAAGEVSYLELPAEPVPVAESGAEWGEESDRGSSPAAEGKRGLFQAVMDMAAGEAQVLLVGDAGLASSR